MCFCWDSFREYGGFGDFCVGLGDGNREMMVKLLDFVGSCDDCSLDNLCAFV